MMFSNQKAALPILRRRDILKIKVIAILAESSLRPLEEREKQSHFTQGIASSPDENRRGPRNDRFLKMSHHRRLDHTVTVCLSLK